MDIKSLQLNSPLTVTVTVIIIMISTISTMSLFSSKNKQFLTTVLKVSKTKRFAVARQNNLGLQLMPDFVSNALTDA